VSTTALAIINWVLQELGVIAEGQTANAGDVQLCLDALNVLADAWLTEPNYAYTTTTVSAALPADTQSRTIGVSQQFNCARPVRLEQGCFARVGTVDYPLASITETEYNEIPIKSGAAGWPEVCFYDAGSPTGNVYFYPTGACTIYLNVLTPISQFTLNAAVTLPPGYARAFKFTLIEEVAGSFSRQVTALQARSAKQARRAIKRTNFVVPQLTYGSQPVIGIPPIY
jgi:hypothetical protein